MNRTIPIHTKIFIGMSTGATAGACANIQWSDVAILD
jgi:hypothetical protein